jgi:hypothetical protein
MVGEFATSMGAPIIQPNWQDLWRREGFTNLAWPDLYRTSEFNPDEYLYKRLKYLDQEKNYPVALLWSGFAIDTKTAWDADRQEQVRRYMHCELPT